MSYLAIFSPKLPVYCQSTAQLRILALARGAKKENRSKIIGTQSNNKFNLYLVIKNTQIQVNYFPFEPLIEWFNFQGHLICLGYAWSMFNEKRDWGIKDNF